MKVWQAWARTHEATPASATDRPFPIGQNPRPVCFLNDCQKCAPWTEHLTTEALTHSLAPYFRTASQDPHYAVLLVEVINNALAIGAFGNTSAASTAPRRSAARPHAPQRQRSLSPETR